MASFLAPTNNPTFSPYISTVNPDLYAQLIIGKQQQYEAGVQRIQSYIDNVTGLEVGRAQDADYLQSVSDNIRTNIEQLNNDFADPTVLRQAENIFHSAYNDRKLQGMVMSNYNKKDAMAQLAKAQEEGTFAVQNADLVQQQILAWEQGDENAVLGKQQYIDWYDHDSEIIKRLKDLDPSMVVTHSADGSLEAYTLIKGEKTYVPKETIRATIDNYYNSNPNAQRQLAIDSDYFTRGMDITTSLDNLKSFYDNKFSLIDNEITELERRKSQENNRPSAAEEYDKYITELKSARGNLQSLYDADLKTAQTDPSSINRKLYKEQRYASLTQQFSSSKVKTTVEANPQHAAWLAQQRYVLDHNKYISSEEQRAIENQRASELHELEVVKKTLENQGLGGASFGMAPGVSFAPIDGTGTEDLTPTDVYQYRDKLSEDVFQEQASMLAGFDINLTQDHNDGKDYWENYMGFNKNTGRYYILPGREDDFHDALTRARSSWEDKKNKDNKALYNYYGSLDENRGVRLEERFRKLNTTIADEEQKGSMKSPQKLLEETIGLTPQQYNKKIFKNNPLTYGKAFLKAFDDSVQLSEEESKVYQNFVDKVWANSLEFGEDFEKENLSILEQANAVISYINPMRQNYNKKNQAIFDNLKKANPQTVPNSVRSSIVLPPQIIFNREATGGKEVHENLLSVIDRNLGSLSNINEYAGDGVTEKDQEAWASVNNKDNVRLFARQTKNGNWQLHVSDAKNKKGEPVNIKPIPIGNQDLNRFTNGKHNINPTAYTYWATPLAENGKTNPEIHNFKSNAYQLKYYFRQNGDTRTGGELISFIRDGSNDENPWMQVNLQSDQGQTKFENFSSLLNKLNQLSTEQVKQYFNIQ